MLGVVRPISSSLRGLDDGEVSEDVAICSSVWYAPNKGRKNLGNGDVKGEVDRMICRQVSATARTERWRAIIESLDRRGR